MKYIVYLTTCVVNDKIYIGVHKIDNEEFDGYIGCGVNIRRPATYKKSKTPFQYAVNKYGTKAFKRTTLATFDKESEAYLLEETLVNKDFIKRPDTYNLIIGGRLNTDHANQYRKVFMYDLDGEFIKEFNTVTEANKFVNPVAVGGGHLSRAIKCGHTHFGYQFSYEKLECMKKFERKHYKHYDIFSILAEEKAEKKSIGRFDVENNLLEEFDDLRSCVKAGYKNAKQVILNKRKYCKGFIFRYI